MVVDVRSTSAYRLEKVNSILIEVLERERARYLTRRQNELDIEQCRQHDEFRVQPECDERCAEYYTVRQSKVVW